MAWMRVLLLALSATWGNNERRCWTLSSRVCFSSKDNEWRDYRNETRPMRSAAEVSCVPDCGDATTDPPRTENTLVPMRAAQVEPAVRVVWVPTPPPLRSSQDDSSAAAAANGWPPSSVVWPDTLHRLLPPDSLGEARKRLGLHRGAPLGELRAIPTVWNSELEEQKAPSPQCIPSLQSILRYFAISFRSRFVNFVLVISPVIRGFADTASELRRPRANVDDGSCPLQPVADDNRVCSAPPRPAVLLVWQRHHHHLFDLRST